MEFILEIAHRDHVTITILSVYDTIKNVIYTTPPTRVSLHMHPLPYAASLQWRIFLGAEGGRDPPKFYNSHVMGY
ncbi:unnamed protein product, partial [Sphenostylis stenocarpa]